MSVSIIIPAYNEETRLPAFLQELTRFHADHASTLTEVLVVDDGSSDGTESAAAAFAGLLPVRVIRLPRNRGKGAAVQAGVQAATGDAIIFMDADGATGPAEIPKLLAVLSRAPIAVGNRWIAGATVAERAAFRAFSGWVYRTYVGLFGLKNIDTMCGFKGFRRAVARELFAHLRDERWLFDTEIMLRARLRRLPIGHVPIAWTSKHGSKLRPSVLVQSLLRIPLLALAVWREERGRP